MLPRQTTRDLSEFGKTQVKQAKGVGLLSPAGHTHMFHLCSELTGFWSTLLKGYILRPGPLIASVGVPEESVGLTKREREREKENVPHFQPAGINSFISSISR